MTYATANGFITIIGSDMLVRCRPRLGIRWEEQALARRRDESPVARDWRSGVGGRILGEIEHLGLTAWSSVTRCDLAARDKEPVGRALDCPSSGVMKAKRAGKGRRSPELERRGSKSACLGAAR